MKWHGNIKCDCGHTQKDHYQGGWCHSSGHPQAGKCGCTWFHPSVHYIKKLKEKKKNEKEQRKSGKR